MTREMLTTRVVAELLLYVSPVLTQETAAQWSAVRLP